MNAYYVGREAWQFVHGADQGVLKIMALMTLVSAIVPLFLHRRSCGSASGSGSLLDGGLRMRIGVGIPLSGLVQTLKILLHQDLDSCITRSFDTDLPALRPARGHCPGQHHGNGIAFIIH